jgi:hypothetical protein
MLGILAFARRTVIYLGRNSEDEEQLTALVPKCRNALFRTHKPGTIKERESRGGFSSFFVEKG